MKKNTNVVPAQSIAEVIRELHETAERFLEKTKDFRVSSQKVKKRASELSEVIAESLSR